jgi:hypothetical protein
MPLSWRLDAKALLFPQFDFEILTRPDLNRFYDYDKELLQVP